MQAYNNDENFRARFISELERHREEDRFTQGTYGEAIDGLWRGCAVACSLRTLDIIDGESPASMLHKDFYDGEVWNARLRPSHKELSRRLCIPIHMAYAEDKVFELLPRDHAMEWPLRFGNAIKCGADLSNVWTEFVKWAIDAYGNKDERTWLTSKLESFNDPPAMAREAKCCPGQEDEFLFNVADSFGGWPSYVTTVIGIVIYRMVRDYMSAYGAAFVVADKLIELISNAGKVK